MSAPKTNIEKQSRRHRGPLIGMWIAVGLALLLFLIWLIWVFAYAEPDVGAPDPNAPGMQGEVETMPTTTTVTPETTPGAETETVPDPQ